MTECLSPSVLYPLQRPVLLWRCWKVAAVWTAVLLLAWLGLGAGTGGLWALHAVAAALGWVIPMLLVWCSLRRWPQGLLHWSGRSWTLEQGAVLHLLAFPQVMLDMQEVLVVRFRQSSGRSCYVLLSSHWAPERWLDLRRAVYSSASLPQADHPAGLA